MDFSSIAAALAASAAVGSRTRNVSGGRPATPAPWGGAGNGTSAPPPDPCNSRFSFDSGYNSAASGTCFDLTTSGCGDGPANASSKLDPNSKPFSPRKSDKPGSLPSARDARDGDLLGVHEKIRHLWTLSQQGGGNGAAAAAAMDKLLNRSGLLPTPSDFPPYGPPADGGQCRNTTSRLTDDFGMRGLLRNIQETARWSSSKYCSVVSQSELGFSASAVQNARSLATLLESPFSNKTLSVLADHYVPSEYCHSSILAGRLPLPGMQYWPTDLLFFLFYVAVGDALQILAGSQLFDRGWRYNKVTRIWLARLPGVQPDERNANFERGVYQYFDVSTWSRTNGRFTLNYQELAEQINPPNECKNSFNTVLMNQIQNQKRKDAAATLAFLKNNPKFISNLSR